MTTFPTALKSWRRARRYSQLDLALEAEISARHLSFLETGRARPSRDMVVRLGEALRLPLDARNQMLTQAGFAVRYTAQAWEDAEMRPIRHALTRQLKTHQPYPGLALDRMWRVQELNGAAARLFGALGIGVGDSLLDLMQSDVMPQIVENWSDVAHHAALRLRTESAAQGGVPAFDHAAQHLSEAAATHAPRPEPVVPVILNVGGQRLSMFSTMTHFGTPEDLMLDALKIELYYPMDDATELAFKAMAADG